MSEQSKQRTANKALMAGLVILPLLTACGPSANTGAGYSLQDVAQAAARQEDRVGAHELATWVIEGRGDFTLVDVRGADEFAGGSIEGARNIPLAQLVREESIASLPPERKVVVYSNGSENGAKGAVLLRLAGVQAMVLTGGYNAWHQQVLNPGISAEELDGEALSVSEQRAYACYFVGEGSGAARQPASSEPFVPPVIEIPEEEDALPPPAAEEGC